MNPPHLTPLDSTAGFFFSIVHLPEESRKRHLLWQLWWQSPSCLLLLLFQTATPAELREHPSYAATPKPSIYLLFPFFPKLQQYFQLLEPMRLDSTHPSCVCTVDRQEIQKKCSLCATQLGKKEADPASGIAKSTIIHSFISLWAHIQDSY